MVFAFYASVFRLWPSRSSGVQIVKSNDTAISSLKPQTATEGSYYNISGVRVAAPAKKGIYIHNGRKFVVK
ncbi:MAG: hypothetical protein II384_01105 [Prevotella sp.]|nr:hypothetical protein [Prevotella sp.]